MGSEYDCDVNDNKFYNKKSNFSENLIICNTTVSNFLSEMHPKVQDIILLWESET